MANIFKQQQNAGQMPKRNNFDLSHQNHLTMKFGYLYPVLCQEVVPGDSFSIEAAFGLKFMPMVFPVQSRMRAHMSYFYVRAKNLQKSFPNMISGLDNTIVPPYISRPKSDFQTSSIYDYLGVPTTIVGSHDGYVKYPIFGLLPHSDTFGLKVYSFDGSHLSPVRPVSSGVIQMFAPKNSYNTSGVISFSFNQLTIPFSPVLLTYLSASSVCVYAVKDDSELGYSYKTGVANSVSVDVGRRTLTMRIPVADLPSLYYSESGLHLGLLMPAAALNSPNLPYTDYTDNLVSEVFFGFGEYSSTSLDTYNSKIRLSALPFRAYEQIYNAYFRNWPNQPFTDENGKVLYNQYCTTTDDGADTTPYHLFRRNYELDFLTSALPSPQQGVAPLVGISALGDVTIEDENGITTGKADLDDHGIITKIVLTSPAASIEHARTAMNIADFGMSINDFRNVNALQRWLEQNLRSGYKYIDFIKGHFGKAPKYSELDMPEYIGGFSRDVNVAQITNQADTYGIGSEGNGAPLGAFAGQAAAFGGSERAVTHYCDDYGFIIGILCVTPEPAYQQLLPKYFLKDNALSYYFPEFSQLGLQPITYKEVMPLQSDYDSIADSSKHLTDTFGYQRPNYDLISAVNEVHGDFRGSLRNFLVNRIFSRRPELGSDFLEIKPEEVNDIFAVTDADCDPILGQVIFKIHAKRPIPRVVIPNLGK